MSKKKWGSILVASALAAVMLAGCSSNTKETIDSANTGSSAAEGPKYTFRLADTHPEGYPTVVGDRKFAELVNEKSGGRIKIEVFPASQLGEEKAVIEQVQLGAIELTRVSTGAMGGFNKEYEVFSLPYIFNSDEHLWKFLESDKGKKLLDSLESSRMKGLAYYSSGARNFYSTKPLTSIADMKGLKVRVIQNKVNIDLMEALGANATPMAYGEVFGALQTGVIDAAENNYPSYDTSNHYQQAKNLILDQHQRVPEVLLISKITWDKLSDADKKIISEAAQESVATQRAEWDKFEKQSEEKIKAAGVTITEVTDFTPWQEAVKPVIEKYRADYSEILDAIEKAK
ncbi:MULTISPECIES: TRAP transporter substrate-binding protein [unclassified Paenibacillus]|uniref:TRAP transporter substrate-binding protein n=1 Tax=unclassified Paenibacillus TaxID=185978 RepID=UPI001044CEF4|nr:MULTISPECIES: TRAP transporter substrate-binding protein [unclassified Paenibacillus]NIK70825.1 tripartite ATP-independent transporter DctP family solute receptor [Paenibacillus sp. BK720]TCM93204.1 tripartite ATP-independent transporter DctP family solute receptor [Paenibacillus sp. BK033]